MSKGPGRLQRAVITELEASADRRLTRRELEDALVGRGYDRSNILRGIRGLRRLRLVGLWEGHTLEDSTVSLPTPAEPLSDEELSRILAELGSRP